MKYKIINTVNWIFAVVLCAFGVCLCTKASLGLSMIAAPPYIIHCFLREMLPWYTQGTSEYIWQSILIIITIISVRRFKLKYLFSVLTGVISGVIIDLWFLVLGGNGAYTSLPVRIAAFIFGSAVISLAVAFVFRTNFPPQVYELIVTEISDRYSLDKTKVKLANDIIMLVISLALSLILTKKLTGIGIGTVIVTFVNAPLIKLFGKLIDFVEKKL